jgi:hypothetical protein
MMSGSSAVDAFDIDFVDRRDDVRVVVRIPGRFSLANRRAANGNRRQFACRAVNVSSTHMMLATPVSGTMGERVIAYFEEFGKIQGSIARVLNGGFVLRIAATTDERSALLRKLIWLEQHKNYDEPDVRTHKRIIPQEPISTLIFPDGTMLQCFVIDMSASGVAVSADVTPTIGAVLAVGKVAGRVVRHFEEGFAVAFKQPQNTAEIERLVIYKC